MVFSIFSSLQYLESPCKPMSEVRCKPIFKCSLFFAILAQGLCLPETDNLTNSTKKSLGANGEISPRSSAAIHESIKEDNPEIKSETESLVEAPVDVAGPRSVETESHSKVLKKRESRNSVQESKLLNIHDCKLRNYDEVKGDNVDKSDNGVRDDAEAGPGSPHHSRCHDRGGREENQIDSGNVVDGRRGEEGEQGGAWNVITTDDEEDEEEDGRPSWHEHILDDDDFHKELKRDGRHSRQGPKIWDQWGKWSNCSVTCGVGKLTRWRHCVAGGCSVGEKEAQLKTCTFAAC